MFVHVWDIVTRQRNAIDIGITGNLETIIGDASCSLLILGSHKVNCQVIRFTFSDVL